MGFPIPDPFVWHDGFKLFYPKFDEEHKAIIKSLYECCKDNSPSNLEKFCLVTANHFADEESSMQRASYDAYSNHKDLHDDFLAKIRSFKAPMSDKDIHFAKDWLVQHIQGIDTKYKHKL